MNLPFFYSTLIAASGEFIDLEEENAKHIVQVLRMKTGDELRLTDGQGTLAQSSISASAKKNCTVLVQSKSSIPPPVHKVIVAISLLKNTSRFEWFLEKAAETGVYKVVPLICHRTERQVFRESRLKSILISAMLQSQQSWLTELSSPVNIEQFIASINHSRYEHSYIAHCEDQDKQELALLVNKQHHHSLVLIGPEGDFTPGEISIAMAAGCRPVQLGETRLRTETAGITAAVLLRQLGG
jgi:16S rRNA (uracil1498-N3)-methyltransferase